MFTFITVCVIVAIGGLISSSLSPEALVDFAVVVDANPLTPHPELSVESTQVKMCLRKNK